MKLTNQSPGLIERSLRNDVDTKVFKVDVQCNNVVTVGKKKNEMFSNVNDRTSL